MCLALFRQRVLYHPDPECTCTASEYLLKQRDDLKVDMAFTEIVGKVQVRIRYHVVHIKRKELKGEKNIQKSALFLVR